MKILHISGFKLLNTANGVHHAIWAYAKQQAALGHTVGILTHSLENAEEIKLIREHGISLKSFSLSKLNEFFIPKGVFGWIFSEFVPDVVHLHYVFQPWVYSIAKRLKTAGIPFLLTPHAGYSHGLLARKAFKKRIASALFEKRKLSWTNLVHALSKEEMQDIRRYGFKGEVIYVPKGIDLEEVQAPAEDSACFKQELQLPLGSILGMFLGRLDPYQKGLDLLLEALHRCMKEIEEAAFYVLLIGPDVFNQAINLTDKIKTLGLERVVSISKPIYGQARFSAVQACDIFLYPSRWEVKPISVLEAMALRRPVFITQETGLGDEVREYQAGVVARAEVDSLASGLLEVLTNRSNLAKWGQNARILIEEQYQCSSRVSELLTYYEKLIISN